MTTLPSAAAFSESSLTKIEYRDLIVDQRNFLNEKIQDATYSSVIQGYLAGPSNTAVGTVAIGSYAANANVTNLRVTAVGYWALRYSTADHMTAVGYHALKSNTTGANNTGIGCEALESNTTGSQNTAVGCYASANCTTGQYNTSVGQQSCRLMTTGQYNTGVGYQVSYSNLTGYYNTAEGAQALYSTTASYNTGFGYRALYANTTGTYNTAIGYNALLSSTTNTNTTGVGHNAAITGSNQVQLGNSATTTYAYGAVQDRSDERDKTDIPDCSLGLNFILSLRPVDFVWNYRDDYLTIQDRLDSKLLNDAVKDGTKKRTRKHHGLIAQDVAATIADLGVEFGGLQNHLLKGGDDVLSIGYSELIAPMIKAIQELTARVAAFGV